MQRSLEIMNKIKISLVDDHQLIREGIGNLIKTFDEFTIVSEHCNGKEFIESLTLDNTPDIVLLDINMPLMDGFETAAYIKKNCPSILILALSMLDDDATIVKMIRLGAKGYILKNTNAQELKEALHTVSKEKFFYNKQTADKAIEVARYRKPELADTNFGLTENEIQYIYYSSLEKSTKEMADLLCVSIRTLEYYRESVYEKTNTKSKVGMILFAIKHKLINID